MNRTITAVVFIFIAVTLGITSLVYVENTYESMNTLMEEISDSMQKKDKEATLTLLKEADKKWDKHKKSLNILLGQKETVTVKGNIKNALLFAEHDDMESAVIYIHQCQVELYRIRETYSPSWHTIL